MKTCPNCSKELRDNFTYCRICGTELAGDNPGDFTTEVLNVFDHGGEFIYLFSESGNPVVLKAQSMDELKTLAESRRYPWIFRDESRNVKPPERQTVKTPEFSSHFLKASALKEPEIIATSSTKRKAESEEGYSPEFEVSRVVNE